MADRVVAIDMAQSSFHLLTSDAANTRLCLEIVLVSLSRDSASRESQLYFLPDPPKC